MFVLKPTTKRMLESYGRHLLGALLSAITAVSALVDKSPIQFNSADWWAVTNALWIAVVPVLIRWSNKYDPAFGRVIRDLSAQVDRDLKKKSSPKKKAVK